MRMNRPGNDRDRFTTPDVISASKVGCDPGMLGFV